MKANKDITVEIIYSKEFNRANLKFSGIPSEECRTEMKKEGWIYSKNHNVWYPKNVAAANSLDFANALKQKYYPDIQVNPEEIITEETEVNEILTMIQDKMGVDAIVAKLSEYDDPQFLEGCHTYIFHEAGHKWVYQKLNLKFSEDLSDEDKKYFTENISENAGRNTSEAMAELFSLKLTGAIIPDKAIEIIQSYSKAFKEFLCV